MRRDSSRPVADKRERIPRQTTTTRGVGVNKLTDDVSIIQAYSSASIHRRGPSSSSSCWILLKQWSSTRKTDRYTARTRTHRLEDGGGRTIEVEGKMAIKTSSRVPL